VRPRLRPKSDLVRRASGARPLSSATMAAAMRLASLLSRRRTSVGREAPFLQRREDVALAAAVASPVRDLASGLTVPPRFFHGGRDAKRAVCEALCEA
jgi:hypothetical protein